MVSDMMPESSRVARLGASPNWLRKYFSAIRVEVNLPAHYENKLVPKSAGPQPDDDQ